MNRDDIIRIAREVWGDDSGKPWSESALIHLEAFANLVAAAEREACALVCEKRAGTVSMFANARIARIHNQAVKGDAEAIRARGKK